MSGAMEMIKTRDREIDTDSQQQLPTVYGLVGSCLTAVHGVTLLFATIALLLSLCVSRLKNLKYLTMLLLLLQ